jgi:hypothetical protein
METLKACKENILKSQKFGLKFTTEATKIDVLKILEEAVEVFSYSSSQIPPKLV